MLRQQCYSCGAVFDSDAAVTQKIDDCYVNVCPVCGCDEYRDVIECDICEKVVDVDYFGTGYIRFKNGYDICNSCLHDYCKERYE